VLSRFQLVDLGQDSLKIFVVVDQNLVFWSCISSLSMISRVVMKKEERPRSFLWFASKVTHLLQLLNNSPRKNGDLNNVSYANAEGKDHLRQQGKDDS